MAGWSLRLAFTAATEKRGKPVSGASSAAAPTSKAGNTVTTNGHDDHMPKTRVKAPPPRQKVKVVPAKVVTTATDSNGYSRFVMAQGRGSNTEYWWLCGACWAGTADEPISDKESVAWELAHHATLCPGYVSQARIQIVWADGHPMTTVRI